MRMTHTTKKPAPMDGPKSARKDRCVDAGVKSSPSGKWMASSAKTPATIAWPANFALARRPRLRCMYSLMKSSRKPTSPSPVIRNSTSSPDADMASLVTTWPIR